MTAMPDIPMRTLPTFRLLFMAWLYASVAGAGWTLAMWAHPDGNPLTGPVAALLVGLGATCGILAIQPWKPRSMATWPMIWVAGSMVRFIVTLGGAFLLYSATPGGTVHLLIGVVLAYLATQVGETRTYAAAMRPTVSGGNPDTA